MTTKTLLREIQLAKGSLRITLIEHPYHRCLDIRFFKNGKPTKHGTTIPMDHLHEVALVLLRLALEEAEPGRTEIAS